VQRHWSAARKLLPADHSSTPDPHRSEGRACGHREGAEKVTQRSIVFAALPVQRILFIALAIGFVGCGPSVMTPRTVAGPVASQTGPAVTPTQSATSVPGGLPERL